MRLLDQVLTPRGGRKAPLQLSLPLGALPPPESPRDAATPRTAARMGKLKSGFAAVGRMLTPRRRQPEAAEDSPASSTPGSGLIAAYRPTMTGLLEAQVRLHSARGSGRQLTTPSPPALPPPPSDSGSDSASEADSDLSSLDGFGDYARERSLTPVAEAAEGTGSSAPSPADHGELP